MPFNGSSLQHMVDLTVRIGVALTLAEPCDKEGRRGIDGDVGLSEENTQHRQNAEQRPHVLQWRRRVICTVIVRSVHEGSVDLWLPRVEPLLPPHITLTSGSPLVTPLTSISARQGTSRHSFHSTVG